jgi:hypothetical protein
MTSIGWEFYGMKFSMLLTMLASLVIFLSVWLSTKRHDHLARVDRMAGDEGED